MVSPEQNSAMNMAGNAEPGMDPSEQRVRNALRSLPKANCPVGFEFRLERRLSGKPVRETRSGWQMSWLGAGFGVAAAMVLSFVVFDFGSVTGTSSAGISGSPMRSGVQIEQSVEVAKTNVETVAPQTTPEQSPEQLVATQDSMKDKTKPGTLPEGNYQTVGTNPK